MNLRTVLCLAALMAIHPVQMYAAEKSVTSEDRIDGKKIEFAKYAKSFVGANNVTVDMAPYKMGAEEGAILLIKGVEGPWDGKAINHKVTPASYKGKSFSTTYEGKPWETLRSRNDYGESWTMYVPGNEQEIPLTPSDGGAQLTDPRKIFKTYMEQNAKKEGASK